MAGLGNAALIVTFSACYCATLKQHTMPVSEHGAMFNQDTQVDEENRVVYIHVPAHRDLPENKFMYEFTTGRLLRCTPSIHRCFLSNFDTQKVPDPSTEEFSLEQFEKRHNTPQTEEVLGRAEHQNMVVTEKIQNTKSLSELMRQTLGSYPLYREEPLPKGAEILEGNVDLNEKTDLLPRQKRVARKPCFVDDICRDPCPGDGRMFVRYARTRSTSCNYLVMCPNPNDRNSCYVGHHTGANFFECLCCRHELTTDTCRGGCLRL